MLTEEPEAMPAIRGLTISVNYAPVLEITLRRNMRHMTECLVITSPEDTETQRVALETPGVRLYITDAFTRHGASFNKGLAFEEAFDFFGRHGWLLIHDADILLPDSMPWGEVQPGRLHGARRRMCENISAWTPDMHWGHCPVARDGGPIGFFQLFDAEDPIIRAHRPWYDVSFAHAGGGDAYFLQLWPHENRVVLPVEVLHLGPKDHNWFGTDQESRDKMAAFIIRNGWDRAHPKVDRSADKRVGEITERVEVPGYAPSNFELPFVARRRAQIRAQSGQTS